MPPASTTTAERPQHLHALARANEIRLARASVKRSIASGEQAAAEVLADPPAALERMPIGELLGCQRRWGDQRVRRLLARVPVSETKEIGGLTERQRRAIIGALDGASTELRAA